MIGEPSKTLTIIGGISGAGKASNLRQHALDTVIREQIVRERNSLSPQILSFGYKNGLPQDADFVIDVRCLPNSHWDGGLRDLSGEDQRVADFFESHSPVRNLLEYLYSLFGRWIPRFEGNSRSYMTIAIGCTGGQHRHRDIEGATGLGEGGCTRVP